MAVRKAEQRIPTGFRMADLGQAISSSDGQAVLISFNPTPVVHQRLQSYVLFVLNKELATQIDQYDWSINNNNILDTVSTEFGYFQYRPELKGHLSVRVEPKGANGKILTNLNLEQDVVGLNPALEALYEQTAQIAPLAGQPEASREVINDLRAYMEELAPRGNLNSDSLNRLIFAIAYVAAMSQPTDKRNLLLEKIVEAFEADDYSTFVEEGRTGIGVCRIRPHILGMYLPKTTGGNNWYLNKKEYPQKKDERLEVERLLIKELKDLPQIQIIDLFNLLRFPKSNLKMALQLLEGLRAQYFPAQEMDVLINDKKKIQLLLDQFKQGPYQQ
ncbi:hypothetical protein Lepto7375DRAFT_3748 [Leptolyngbya sp. PCC 7375]|nr:hypothetical protein Lepto7375DRAFT_3748 [Leptolyngbya sp. PCC 7375]